MSNLDAASDSRPLLLSLLLIYESPSVSSRLVLCICQNTLSLALFISGVLKGVLYRIRCGVNRLGDGGVKVV